MGTVRTFGDKTVMTHYFSTRYEVEKFAGKGRETGWYYQDGSDPSAKMRGPFRLLEDVEKAVKK